MKELLDELGAGLCVGVMDDIKMLIITFPAGSDVGGDTVDNIRGAMGASGLGHVGLLVLVGAEKVVGIR
jgi:hypothetical protein